MLYGSQTGTAQDVAEGLAGDAAARGFPTTLDCAEGWSLARLSALPPQQLLLFVVSTTGDGELPDNAKALWRSLLRRDAPAGALAGRRVAVFGLGDSAYAKFNAGARKLWARLTQLGCESVVPRGLGDEQSPLGLEGDFDIWARGLWAALEAAHPLPPGAARTGTGGPQLRRCR